MASDKRRIIRMNKSSAIVIIAVVTAMLFGCASYRVASDYGVKKYIVDEFADGKSSCPVKVEITSFERVQGRALPDNIYVVIYNATVKSSKEAHVHNARLVNGIPMDERGDTPLSKAFVIRLNDKGTDIVDATLPAGSICRLENMRMEFIKTAKGWVPQKNESICIADWVKK
jgi:hypothetical protein